MDAPLNYKRVLLKLSGESFAGENSIFNSNLLHKIALDIQEVNKQGVEVCLVVGGGNIYRGEKGSQDFNIDRVTSDHMGMLATVINALSFQAVLESIGTSSRVMTAIPMTSVAEPYIRRRALRHMEKGRVVIFAAGTGNPYFTTDTAAALRAMEMECDLFLKGTKVPGIFSDDPVKNKEAFHYEMLTHQQVIDKSLNVMDQTAFTLISEKKIPIIVFSIYEEKSFVKALRRQNKHTLVTHEL